MKGLFNARHITPGIGCTLMVFTALFVAGVACAQSVPDTITYQGRLTDSSGQPVADGNHQVTVTLYDALTGGAALWSSGPMNVSTTGGVFTAQIQSVASSVFSQPNVWLQVEVEGSILTPRVKLTSVPYAFLAGGLAFPVSSVSSSASPLLLLINTGSGGSGSFRIDNPANGSDALYAATAGPGSAVRAFAAGNGHAVNAYAIGSGAAIFGWAGGTGLAGDFIGTVKMNGFRMPTGASNGYVLTSDASGIGSWQPASGVGGGLVLPYSGSTPSSSNAFSVTQTGTGEGGRFEVDNPTGGSYALHVKNNSASAPAVYAEHTGTGTGAGGVFMSENGTGLFGQTTSGIDNQQKHAGVVGLSSGLTGSGGWFSTTDINNADPAVLAETVGRGTAVKAVAGTGGLAGDFLGTLQTTGFKMPSGAAEGKVLTSDSGGVATWQTPAIVAASGSDNFIPRWNGDSSLETSILYESDDGRIGIGTTYPLASLDVVGMIRTNVLGTTDSSALELQVNGTRALRIVPSPMGFNIIGGNAANWVTDGANNAVIAGGGWWDMPNRVSDDGGTVSGGRDNLAGNGGGSTYDAQFATVAGGEFNRAGGAYSAIGGGAGNTAFGVGATVAGGRENSASGEDSTVAGGYGNRAKGMNSFAAGWGAKADHNGTFVWSDSNTGFTSTAVNQFLIKAWGGVGINTNSPYPGSALDVNGPTRVQGVFQATGDTSVLGSLYVSGSKNFRIDHPLDPENKYLLHSCIESSEMANIYSGNAVLDEIGEAVVELPDWFEALNKDFRYQLTCIGGFAPVYVAEEIKDNQFKIAGGKAGMKVSWQITGIRNDAYARAHPFVTEQDKPEKPHSN